MITTLFIIHNININTFLRLNTLQFSKKLSVYCIFIYINKTLYMLCVIQNIQKIEIKNFNPGNISYMKFYVFQIKVYVTFIENYKNTKKIIKVFYFSYIRYSSNYLSFIKYYIN